VIRLVAENQNPMNLMEKWKKNKNTGPWRLQISPQKRKQNKKEKNWLWNLGAVRVYQVSMGSQIEEKIVNGNQ